VWTRAQAARLGGAGRRRSKEDKNSATESKGFPPVLPLEAIGSGSDFGAFLDHLGIASVNFGFGGEDRSGTYHSAYDTPWFVQHFGDKSATYGKVLAQTAGTMVLRLANATVLPYSFSNLAATVKTYADDLKSEVKNLQGAAAAQAEQVALKVPQLVNDPQNPVQPAKALSSPPDMDFAALDQSVEALRTAAAKLDNATKDVSHLTPERTGHLDEQLAVAERKLISADGLPGRTWMRHLLYAPGTYSGYGAKTLPGVSEAIEGGRYPEAQSQLDVLTKALNAEAEYLGQIASSYTANGS
jgi:N-acetylated-alpha-linked acidic dipeptidase